MTNGNKKFVASTDGWTEIINKRPHVLCKVPGCVARNGNKSKCPVFAMARCLRDGVTPCACRGLRENGTPCGAKFKPPPGSEAPSKPIGTKQGTSAPKAPGENLALEGENRRLREELAKLKGEEVVDPLQDDSSTDKSLEVQLNDARSSLRGLEAMPVPSRVLIPEFDTILQTQKDKVTTLTEQISNTKPIDMRIKQSQGALKRAQVALDKKILSHDALCSQLQDIQEKITAAAAEKETMQQTVIDAQAQVDKLSGQGVPFKATSAHLNSEHVKMAEVSYQWMSKVPHEIAKKINEEMGIDGINLQQGLLGFKEAIQAASAHTETAQPQPGTQPPDSIDMGIFDFDLEGDMEVDDKALAAAVERGFELPKNPAELPKLFVAFHKAEIKRHKSYTDAVKKTSIKKK
jgi:hypothetical protein